MITGTISDARLAVFKALSEEFYLEAYIGGVYASGGGIPLLTIWNISEENTLTVNRSTGIITREWITSLEYLMNWLRDET